MFCHHEPRLIQKAKTKRRVSPSYHQQSALAKQMQRPVQVGIFNGLKTFRKRVSADAVAEAFRKGSYESIMKVIPWDRLTEDVWPGFRAVEKTLISSSKFSIQALPAPKGRKLRFDTENPRVRRYLDSHAGQLIVGVQEDTRKIVGEAVRRSMNRAMTPRQVADEIVGSIGLDPRREAALRNFSIQQQKDKVSAENQVRNNIAYRDRLLNDRAMTIARTETRNATNQGQIMVWQEGADQGFFDRQTAKKVWIVDGAPCEVCEPMDGVAVPLDGVWQLNTGQVVSIPSESHPNCFCGMELEFGE